jgi:hypothetical protein
MMIHSKKQLENSVQKWQFNVNSCNMLGTALKCALVCSVALEALSDEMIFSSNFSQDTGFYLAIVLAAQTFSTYKLESQQGRLDCIKDLELAR